VPPDLEQEATKLQRDATSWFQTLDVLAKRFADHKRRVIAAGHKWSTWYQEKFPTLSRQRVSDLLKIGNAKDPTEALAAANARKKCPPRRTKPEADPPASKAKEGMASEAPVEEPQPLVGSGKDRSVADLVANAHDEERIKAAMKLAKAKGYKLLRGKTVEQGCFLVASPEGFNLSVRHPQNKNCFQSLNFDDIEQVEQALAKPEQLEADAVEALRLFKAAHEDIKTDAPSKHNNTPLTEAEYRLIERCVQYPNPALDDRGKALRLLRTQHDLMTGKVPPSK
jgi:hypothetical protein